MFRNEKKGDWPPVGDEGIFINIMQFIRISSVVGQWTSLW